MRIAARIVAASRQAAVALLARLDEHVAAFGRIEQTGRLVAQTVVHAVLESQRQIL